MTSSGAGPGAGEPAVTVHLASGEVRVTQSDGRAIRDAMAACFETNPAVRRLPLLTRASLAWVLPADEVHVGQDLMRIGAWLLQERAGRLVLAHRSAPTAPVGFQYLATVTRGPAGWQVSDLGWERVYFERP